ncbi:MAG: glutathione ABC transporter permease GsiC [Rhodobacteraceae bacterium]|jgi:peptide/nickel transport system permease protein|uniref:ABC transporter permease n=1 Tax=Stappia TaxID=152161 RepID=UPI000C6A43DE|nr:ABC transporter permease [Stappia stellulata]MBC01638.1 glutathione ABC transporter permease GsiC [Paracoccaceae bacterium]MCA1243288.1 ABC transporter permease [Stappia stellulata]|eukprot:jgi/Tetstr1/445348/TSEL_033146.t1
MVFLRRLRGRLIDLAFVIAGVSVLVFGFIRMIPGDAVAIMLGANAEVTPERIAAVRTRLGLDLPIHEQYVAWLSDVLRGDFGVSIWTGKPVIDEIAAHVWPTLQLTLLALATAVILAIPLGILMARLRGRRGEALVQAGSVVGLTVPPFWLGIIMILTLSAVAPGVQMLGYVPFSQDPLGNLARLILPAIALSLPIMANLARLLRSTLLEAMQQDYIRTARAKGVPARRVLYRHALRNALIPFITSVGIMAGYLLGGAIVIEQVFAIPGLGRLILGAIAERNYPLIQATILLVTCSFVFVNFAVDVVYALIDPRISE